MKYGALVGWGIVIYAVMSLAWSGLAIYGFTGGILPRIVELLVLLVVATVAGRSLKFRSWKDVVPYSIGWALIAILLDGIFSVPLTGWRIYADWNIWFGYALLVLVPLIAPFLRKVPDAPRTWET